VQPELPPCTEENPVTPRTWTGTTTGPAATPEALLSGTRQPRRKGVRGKPVTTFTRNTTVYKQNSRSDRDKDGIACEKR
jgi:hypothetical protein